MKKIILITGVAGFIGFSVTKNLLKRNYKVLGVDNLNNYYNQKLKKKRIEQLKSKNFKFIKLDLKNKNQINKNLKNKKIDLIIHFAAQPGVRYSVNEPHSYIENNVLVFSNILEFVKSKKIKLIYSSSSSVYGDTDKHPIYEHSKLNPKNIYAMTKKNNEEQAEIYSKSYGLSIIGLRFFTVFGEWGRPDMLILKFLIYAKKGLKFQLYNYGNHYRDFTYINDLFEMIYPLIKNYQKIKKGHEIYNVCSNRSVHLKKVINILKKLTNYKNIKNIKRSELEVFKTHGSRKKLENFTKIKYKISNIEESIIKTFNWFEKNKKLFN
jgi:UDP-glucuronate 4-epimerase